MSEFFKFAAENPFLTFFLAVVVFGALESMIASIFKR